MRKHITMQQREAYEDFRDWAIDVMAPALQKEVRKKIKSIASQHGISAKELVAVLYHGTPGETRPQLMGFMYDVFFN